MQLKLRFSKVSRHFPMLMALRYGKPPFPFKFLVTYLYKYNKYQVFDANAKEIYYVVTFLWRHKLW